MRRVILVLILLSLAGCQKEEEPVDTNVTMVVDHAYAERGLLSVFPLVNALQAGPGRWHLITSHTCAVLDSVVGDTAAFPANGPVTLHLRYPGGCADVDGHVRSGLLTVTLAGDLTNAGDSALIRSPDLAVDAFHHLATFTVFTIDSARHEVHVDTSATQYQGAWSKRFTGWLYYTRAAGQGDTTAANDAYSVNTVLDGADRDGNTYNAGTATALSLALDCPWIRSGHETIQPVELSARELEYGPGTCDPDTRITVEGEEVGLTIP